MSFGNLSVRTATLRVNSGENCFAFYRILSAKYIRGVIKDTPIIIIPHVISIIVINNYCN